MIHTDLFSQIVNWAKTPAKERKPPALFLYGPPGIGKTTLAHAALEAAGYRVVEWNASQHRHRAAVEDSLVPLLNSRNVADFFRPEGPRNLGLVLDEIDGMSVGDKGGLVELQRILKEYNGENAIVCISNEWMEKKFQPFQKICKAFQVSAPTEQDVFVLLEAQFPTEEDKKPSPDILRQLTRDLLSIHSGDIRKILQSVREIRDDLVAGTLNVDTVRSTIVSGLTDARALGTNRIHRSETIKTAVGQLLRGELDMFTEVPLNNNDLNLAGLHLHESLPTWLRKYEGNNRQGYDMYLRSFQSIVSSDRLDYYTFFFQHWTLFPLTYQAKIQAVNNHLFGWRERQIRQNQQWKDTDMEYTSVLSKQSMLYNQFRYMCEMRDLFVDADVENDGGFDSTYWYANLFLITAQNRLKDPVCPGYGKKVGGKVWENVDFWRGALPAWFPNSNPQRFMRLLQSLDIPRPAPFIQGACRSPLG